VRADAGAWGRGKSGETEPIESMSHPDAETEYRATVLELAQQAVNFCLLKLIDLGLVSLGEVNGKWYIQFDRARLEPRGLGAAATLDRDGMPVVYLLPTLSVKDLALAIAHESVHLMQLCKGDLVPMYDYHFWKGAQYPTLRADSPDYFEAQPWETQARELQPILTQTLGAKGFPI
jgi:hypothetical protein